MIKRRPHRLLSIAALICIITVLTTNTTNANALENDEPKVGLVLSGGGAAGIAHIGVLKVLEEVNMPIDIVTGTSMGGLLGALFAIGYTADQISEVVSGADWRLLFSDEINRDFLPLEDKVFEPDFLISLPYDYMNINLPIGAIAGHQITKLFTRLTVGFHDYEDFTQLPRPFAAIATDIETGEMVVLDKGFLPLAMRASMSIPSAFTPVEIDNRFLVDGGLVRNLPVQNAKDLGADFIISVNASSSIKNREDLAGLQDILAQTIAIAIRPNMDEQKEYSDIHFTPDLGDLGFTSFSDISRLIDAGYEAALEKKDLLQNIADSLNNLKPSYSKPESLELITEFDINNVSVRGLDRLPEEVVLTAFGELSELKSIEDIESGIDRIQAMRYFHKVFYKVLKNEDGSSDIIITVAEQQNDRFNLGFRYDNDTRAALLLNLRIRGRILPFSTLRLTARLGEELQFQVQNLMYTNTRPKLAVYSIGEYNARDYSIFEDENRIANVQTNSIVGEILLGPLYSEGVMAGLGYRYELYEQTRTIGLGMWEVDWTPINIFFGQILMDGLNSNSFPTRGFKMIARTEWTIPFVENQIQFSRHFLELENRAGFGGYSSFISQLNLGQGFGRDLPLHYNFFMGTSQSFLGYRRHGLRGRAMVSASFGWQYNVYPDIYITTTANSGNVFSELYDPSNFDDILYGWGLSLGWDSVIGPISVTYMGSPRNPGIVEFRAGFEF